MEEAVSHEFTALTGTFLSHLLLRLVLARQHLRTLLLLVPILLASEVLAIGENVGHKVT